VINPNMVMKKTIAVPSLSIDSLSVMVDSRLLAPTSFRIATTATGSVALIMAPNRKASSVVHSFSPIPIDLMSNKANAVITIATIIPGTASIIALTNDFLNVCMCKE